MADGIKIRSLPVQTDARDDDVLIIDRNDTSSDNSITNQITYQNLKSSVIGDIDTEIELDELIDVSVPGAQQGDVLMYDGTQWTTGQVVTELELDDLTDVSVPGAQQGDFLMYDGTQWTTGQASQDTSGGQSSDYIFLGGGDDAIEFQVTVGPKSTWNQFYGHGSSDCFYINGVEAPVLMLPANRTFKFIQSDASNAGNPFSLFAEISPGQLNRYDNMGVSYTGTPGTDGVTEITFTNLIELSFGKYQISDQTPRKLFYRHQDKDDNSKQFMGNTITNLSHGINDNIGDIGGDDGGGGFPGGGGGFPGPLNAPWGLSDVIDNFQDRIKQLEDQAGL